MLQYLSRLLQWCSTRQKPQNWSVAAWNSVNGSITYHRLSMLCVRETNSNWLVDEKHIGVFIPPVRIELRFIVARDSAWPLTTA